VDKEKFIEVINENKNLLYKICNSYCQNPSNRQDLVQEILLQLWKNIKSFDGRVKISTWIYKIALNTAISNFRLDCKRVDKPIEIDFSFFSLPDFEYDSEFDEKLQFLHKLIDGMSKADKALLLLYLDNYKQKEIAEIIGITESNVATKVNRIKQNLREKFSNY
jgi:RNA polymerase sigma factor (sigma-70 family)